MYFWIFVFIISLIILVKGADWFLDSAESIGLRFGMSSIAIGVLIVGVGTSLPELASSIAAVIAGVLEIVVANAVGSNITNILLVIGVAAVVGRRIIMSLNLVDWELPFLAIATVLFLGVVYDGNVGKIESLFLITAYIVYLAYSLLNNNDTSSLLKIKNKEIEKKIVERKRNILLLITEPFGIFKDYIQIVVGLIMLYFGSQYTVSSVIELSQIFGVATSVISLSAIALGTSLPELVVSTKAVLARKYEVAIGNVLGSNSFNALMVVGIPGVMTQLPVSGVTLTLAIPVMAFVTFLFIISSLSKTIHHWGGMLFLILYAFFILKLFGAI